MTNNLNLLHLKSTKNPHMQIYSYQFGAIIVGVMLGVGPLFLGRIAVNEAGRDAWIAITIASIFVILNVLALMALAKRFPNEHVIEYSQKLLGRVGGIFFACIWLLFGVLMCAITLFYAGHIFQTYILFFTPVQLTMLLMLLLCIYVAWFDLRVLGRVTVVIFLIAFPFKIFFVPPLVEHAQWLRVLPMFSSEWSDLLVSSISLLFSFAGYELLLMFYPYVKDKDKASKHALMGVGYVCLMFIVAVLTQQVVYDESFLKKLWAPSIHYVSLGSFPIIDRIDLVFILFWFCVLFKTLSTYFYATQIGLQSLVGTKGRKWQLVGLAVLVYIPTLLPINRIEVEYYYKWTLGIIVTMSFVVPILFLFLYAIQKHKKGANA